MQSWSKGLTPRTNFCYFSTTRFVHHPQGCILSHANRKEKTHDEKESLRGKTSPGAAATSNGKL